MGTLYNFNFGCKTLAELKELYNITTFVETGCFYGDSLTFARDRGFAKLYSCDIDLEMINHCQNRLGNDVELFHGDSKTFFINLLPKLDPAENVMFFLDAHLPGFDKTQGTSGVADVDANLNFPLQEEIKMIHMARRTQSDVIIVDDLRIYEDGPYGNGNWAERHQFGLSLDFLGTLSYNIQKFYADEGYLLLTR